MDRFTHLDILKFKIRISLYSTWWISPGKKKLLEPALKQLAKDVMENEKGTLMYLIHTPLFDFPKAKTGKKAIVSEPAVRPGTIIFVEKYESWDAFQEHLYGSYFTTFVEKHKSLFVLSHDNEPFIQVVFMEENAGFIRSIS